MITGFGFSGCLTASQSANERPSNVKTDAGDFPINSESKAVDDAGNAPRVLEEKFYVDGDGNVIPDFLEAEFGFDPLENDCPYKDCGSGANGESLNLRERNALLILDSSGSMRARNKMSDAKQALERYARTISGVQNLGLMVYGHRGDNSENGKAESCAGIDLLASIGEVRRENFSSVLSRFEPTGWTPIAEALNKANEAFAGREQGNNRIILVSDGIETCGGDPVEAAKNLHESGFRVTVDVVGFGVGKDDANNLRKIAEIAGGEYTDAKTGADLEEYLKKQMRAVYQTRAALTCEIGNLMHTPLCDQQMVNKSLFYLMKLRDDAFKRQRLNQQDGDDERVAREKQMAEAYNDLMNRISAAKNERDKKSREAVSRYRELDRKMDELGRQMRDVYGDN